MTVASRDPRNKTPSDPAGQPDRMAIRWHTDIVCPDGVVISHSRLSNALLKSTNTPRTYVNPLAITHSSTRNHAVSALLLCPNPCFISENGPTREDNLATKIAFPTPCPVWIICISGFTNVVLLSAYPETSWFWGYIKSFDDALLLKYC